MPGVSSDHQQAAEAANTGLPRGRIGSRAAGEPVQGLDGQPTGTAGRIGITMTALAGTPRSHPSTQPALLDRDYPPERTARETMGIQCAETPFGIKMRQPCRWSTRRPCQRLRASGNATYLGTGTTSASQNLHESTGDPAWAISASAAMRYVRIFGFLAAGPSRGRGIWPSWPGQGTARTAGARTLAELCKSHGPCIASMPGPVCAFCAESARGGGPFSITTRAHPGPRRSA
jgi:hypothetical protein